MEKSTLGTIYALKQGEGTYDERVAKYWSEYTGTPIKRYDNFALTEIAQDVFCDYIKTADMPNYEVERMFNFIPFDYRLIYPLPDESFDSKIRNAIWSALALTRIKKDDKYINGFEDFENLEAE